MYDQPENPPNRLNAKPAELQQNTPNYRLHDAKSIAFATFFGSPLAGAALLALNYRWLQKGRAAAMALVGGFVLTVLAITCGYLIPSTYTTAVAVSLVVVMKSVANSLQGEAITQHLQRGGQLASKWTAGGTGIGIGVLLFGIIFAVEIARQMDTKIVIGTKDEVFSSGDANQPEMISGFEEVGRQIAPEIGGFPITLRLTNGARTPMRELTVGKVIINTTDELYYLGSATQSEAVVLGQLLKSAGFFNDRGAMVLLSKGDDGTAIPFVVTDGMWDRPDHLAAFEGFVRQSAPSVGGLPIKLFLRDIRLDTKKVVTVS